ncbi:hypothetical protein NLJ89_g11467 [Agrocybe chaxingu]|uniref:Uncharacterized protein n=1 Tax=Agrocybe chaxingu TaxID=84603 RepID=A0A9W8JLU7_9AGAR|nr:hypothetical protein NLJ89_g11467 [Agrocybe chaxingu]
MHHSSTDPPSRGSQPPPSRRSRPPPSQVSSPADGRGTDDVEVEQVLMDVDDPFISAPAAPPVQLSTRQFNNAAIRAAIVEAFERPAGPVRSTPLRLRPTHQGETSTPAAPVAANATAASTTNLPASTVNTTDNGSSAAPAPTSDAHANPNVSGLRAPLPSALDRTYYDEAAEFYVVTCGTHVGIFDDWRLAQHVSSGIHNGCATRVSGWEEAVKRYTKAYGEGVVMFGDHTAKRKRAELPNPHLPPRLLPKLPPRLLHPTGTAPVQTPFSYIPTM